MTFPLDVLRTRLAAQHESYRAYYGVHDAILKMWKGEKLVTMYRGLLPTLMQVGPHTGAQFMGYNIFDGLFRKFFKMDETSFSLANTLVSGGLSGAFAKAALYPLDLIKKRLQAQTIIEFRHGFGKPFTCRYMTECLIFTMKEEGIAGLYKGLKPSLIKAVVSTAFHFTAYESIIKAMATYKPS